MESNITSQKQDSEASMNRLSKNRNVLGENGLERLVRRLNHDHVQTLILNVKQLQSGKHCMKDSLLQSIFVLDGRIPKHMVTLGDKYLRRCLESVHTSASTISTYNIPTNLKSKTGYSPSCPSPAEIISERSPELRRFVFESPSPEHWIVGSIMGSKSMVNIMNSHLFTELSVSDDDDRIKGLNFDNVKGTTSYDFMNSSQKPPKETSVLQNHRYGSNAAHDKFVTTHGVLQCIWKGGVPQFIFSVDDHKGSYVANLWKTDLPDHKAMDFVYLFHSEVHGMESKHVGKMKISTLFTLSENNSKFMEREFVLFGCNEKFAGESQSSAQHSKKNKLSKVVKVLKISHSSKLRSFKAKESSTTLENYPGNNDSGVVCLVDNEFPPSLELAAIVVKEHLTENREEKFGGGWGLKFLKKTGANQNAKKSSVSTGVCTSTSSMDVLVPAGIHGGPISINGGPSSIVERWKSGGHCDCGGWDLGCQTTVLKTKEKTLPHSSTEECCRFIDLFVKGSEHGAPTLRMVNVRDGLYFIHFRSTLSMLQSFSIAVAYIHSQSPTLRPKNPEEVN